MHRPVKDHLEEYLAEPENGRVLKEVQAHLESCGDCVRELSALQEQHGMLQAIRPNRVEEPAPGFYARVMSRIEKQEEDSVWSVFLEPVFGKRLAYVCGALVLLLGTYLVSTEPAEHMTPTSDIVLSQPSDSMDGQVQPRQRDAVLVNLVTFKD
jgi:hypothetical protein